MALLFLPIGLVLALTVVTTPRDDEQKPSSALADAQKPAAPADAQKPAVLADAQKSAAPANAPNSPGKPFDVKNAHLSVCGYCHGDFGRAPGKAPMLMNSPRTDEYTFNIIKNGKPGKMAAFKIFYNDDQIRAMVKFYRNLKQGVEPVNPS